MKNCILCGNQEMLKAKENEEKTLFSEVKK